MKQKKKNSKKSDSSSSVQAKAPAVSTAEPSVNVTSAKENPSQLGNDAPTIALPSDLNSPSRTKASPLDRSNLRRINELQQEQDSLTPTASNSDFLNAGGWNSQLNADQTDDQPPRVARISFSEPPEDLAALDFESMQLPPMDLTAKPSTAAYSLHFLLTSPQTLPPVSEFCPRQNPNGRLQLTSMRDRPLHAPLAPGTPTRAQALMAMRDSYTAGFLERTGLAIPPELDPDIPSRRESNLSQADLDADQDYEDADADPNGLRGCIPPAPPATPGTPARSQRATSSESPSRFVEERAAVALDHSRLVSALGALAECGDEEEQGDEDDSEIKPAAAPPSDSVRIVDEGAHGEIHEAPNQAVDGWVLGGIAISFAVVVGALLLRARP